MRPTIEANETCGAEETLAEPGGRLATLILDLVNDLLGVRGVRGAGVGVVTMISPVHARDGHLRVCAWVSVCSMFDCLCLYICRGTHTEWAPCA